MRSGDSKPSAQDAFIERETARVATHKSPYFYFWVAPVQERSPIRSVLLLLD